MLLRTRVGEFVDERARAVRHGPHVGGAGDRHHLGLRGEIDQRGTRLGFGGGEPRGCEIQVKGRNSHATVGAQVEVGVRLGRFASDGHHRDAGASGEADDGSGQPRQIRTRVAARDDHCVELVRLPGRAGGREVVDKRVNERVVSGLVDVEEVVVDRRQLRADSQRFDVYRRGPRVDDQLGHEMTSQGGATVGVP